MRFLERAAPVAMTIAAALPLTACGERFNLTAEETVAARTACHEANSRFMAVPWIDQFCECYVSNYSRYVSKTDHDAFIATGVSNAGREASFAAMARYCIR